MLRSYQQTQGPGHARALLPGIPDRVRSRRNETAIPEQPDQHHVEKSADRDRVPHDHRNAGGDAVDAQPAILEKFIELPKRGVVQRFLPFGLRLDDASPATAFSTSVWF